MSQQLGIIHKTRDNARIVDGDSSPARANAEQAWWEWVTEHVGHRLRAYSEGLSEEIGEAMAEYVGQRVGPLERELELLRREFTVLRQEVGVERGLRDLRAEVAAARKEVPKLPAIASRLEAEQARLQRELDATKDKLGKLRVDQSITDYNLREMRKQAQASAGASIEMEFEGTSSHFQIKAAHPDAAKTLREFAAGIISGQADGTIWLPGSAGTA